MQREARVLQQLAGLSSSSVLPFHFAFGLLSKPAGLSRSITQVFLDLA